MPSQISRHHKKPVLRAFSVYTFHVFFKKSISITPTKRANRSSHCQFVCSMVRPFHSFHSLRYFAALPFISLFRSFMPACRSRASHRYTRLALRAMLASLALIHFITQLIRSATSSAHSFHSFHVRPLFTYFRICQVFCWLSPRLE